MLSASKIYADTVRYWYQVNKNIPTSKDEPKRACPGLGSMMINDDALIAATIYTLANLPESSEVAKQN